MQKHIVIIANDLLMRSTMTTVLLNAGYKVTEMELFTSIERLAELQAECFILDEQIPHISGHILGILLKSTQQTKSIPVILTAATVKLPYFSQLCEANGTLQRPFANKELLEVVARVCC